MSLSRSRVTFLVPVLLLASASWTAVLAQGTPPFCPGNLVANGNFTNGLVAGKMPSIGAVANWSRAYETPDVSAAMGCQDVGAVGMWGNLNTTIGEGLQQSLGSNALVAGKTYLVDLCVRRINDPDKQNYAIFRVRASALPKTSAGTADTMGNNILDTPG